MEETSETRKVIKKKLGSEDKRKELKQSSEFENKKNLRSGRRI
jgi:hypothetical protein